MMMYFRYLGRNNTNLVSNLLNPKRWASFRRLVKPTTSG